MAGLKEIIDVLRPFLADPRIEDIIQMFDSKFGRVLDSELINMIRPPQLRLLDEEDCKLMGNTLLANAVHDVLIRLAELDEDYLSVRMQDVSLDTNSKNKVVNAFGQIFDLGELIQHHHLRSFRPDDSPPRKLLINPLCNEPFSVRDAQHIQKFALDKKMPIPNLKLPLVDNRDISHGKSVFKPKPNRRLRFDFGESPSDISFEFEEGRVLKSRPAKGSKFVYKGGELVPETAEVHETHRAFLKVKDELIEVFPAKLRRGTNRRYLDGSSVPPELELEVKEIHRTYVIENYKEIDVFPMNKPRFFPYIPIQLEGTGFIV